MYSSLATAVRRTRPAASAATRQDNVVRRSGFHLRVRVLDAVDFAALLPAAAARSALLSGAGGGLVDVVAQNDVVWAVGGSKCSRLASSAAGLGADSHFSPGEIGLLDNRVPAHGFSAGAKLTLTD